MTMPTRRPDAPLLRAAAMLGLITAILSTPRDEAAAQTRAVPVLTLEAAKAIAGAAEEEARRNGWSVAIAVVDPWGGLIVFHRMDDVQVASLDIAVAKARTAARYRRPTRALADAIAAGRQGLLAVEGLLPLEGGLPITIDGTIVGGIGVSGMTGEQDAVVATAGLAALER